MGTIDFLQSPENNKPKSASKKQNNYSIEYTDPSDLADHFAKPAPVKPAPVKQTPITSKKSIPASPIQSPTQPKTKSKRSWFSFAKKKTAITPTAVPTPVITSTPTAQSTPQSMSQPVLPSAPGSTTQAPVLTQASTPAAIGRAPQQGNAGDVVIVSPSTPQVAPRTATSQPVQKPSQQQVQQPIARQIPLAPPPPTQPANPAVSQTVNSVASVPVQSQHAPQTIDASLPHFQMQASQQPAHIPTAPQAQQQNVVAVTPAAAPVTVPAASSIPSVPPVQSVPKPTTELRTVEQKGAIHAQNVSRISGKETDPEPMAEAPFEVNLLPASLLKELTPESKASRLVKTVLVTTTCVGLVYMGMIMYRAYFIYQTKNNQIEITRLETEIAKYSTLQTDINAANAKVVAIDDLLNQHVYWTNFFALLEHYTLPNVQYITFSGNVEGNVTLQAVTTDFASVSRQVEVFRDATEFITNISVSTATRTSVQGSTDETTSSETDAALPSSTVEFAISASVNPDIFLYEFQSLLQ